MHVQGVCIYVCDSSPANLKGPVLDPALAIVIDGVLIDGQKECIMALRPRDLQLVMAWQSLLQCNSKGAWGSTLRLFSASQLVSVKHPIVDSIPTVTTIITLNPNIECYDV